MVQAPFAYSQAAYDAANDAANDAGVMLSLAIFADRAHVLGQLREDAVSAGFHVTAAQPVEHLLKGDAHPLGEVVLVDCPSADATSVAALSRLDMRAAQAGIQLIVSTTLEALDDVFGCLDQSGAQLLVDPCRSDYVMALGRARALAPRGRLREMAEEDRLALLRLTEQVGQIATQLGRIGGSSALVQAPVFAFAGAPDHDEPLVRKARPPLPDPRLVRCIIRQRQQRARCFDAELFADPAWDMLLDLTAARGEMKRVSVTSLCIAAAVPPTTALRWIGQMCEVGIFQRVEDMADRRRAFIELSDKAADAMARYFDLIDEGVARPASAIGQVSAIGQTNPI